MSLHVQIAGLPSFSNLRCLLVHGAALTRIEGLERCVSLEELNLSANSIELLEGLSTLTNLRALNLARCPKPGSLHCGEEMAMTQAAAMNSQRGCLTRVGGRGLESCECGLPDGISPVFSTRRAINCARYRGWKAFRAWSAW